MAAGIGEENAVLQREAPNRTEEGKQRGYLLAGNPVVAPRLVSGLHVVATPIGNLRDITLRALETLAAADVIACEDTRVTSKLTSHYGIATRLTPYHEHNAAQARPRLMARLAEGEAVALASDAGTPLISDPGYKLVREARDGGHLVTAAPGPSALLTALSIAGLPTDRFHFEGFLPAKPVARQRRISQLKTYAGTLVFYESGPRLAAALGDLAAGLGEREVAVCRELTKLHEEVRRGRVTDLAAEYDAAAEPKGEIVLLVGPRAEDEGTSPASLDEMLRDALARGSVKDAVAEVATVTGEPRAEVYRRALALTRRERDGQKA